MTKNNRKQVRKIDDELLRKLWATKLPEHTIAEKMGHHRNTLRRRAVKLGLPSSRKELWEKP